MVYVQPGAKRIEIVGFYGDALKIRLASQSIDGCENDDLLNFVAQLFDVPRRQVELIRSGKSQHKKVAITKASINRNIHC